MYISSAMYKSKFWAFLYAFTSRKPSEISKKLIIQNKLGSVYSAHISAIFKRSKTVSNLNFTSLSKAGGGPIIDLGSHFVDLAWWIMGNPNPISVYTYSSNKLSKYLKINENVPWKKFNVEDYVFGVVKCEKGKSINFLNRVEKLCWAQKKYSA